ncbi:MAG: deoxynucleoside kinase [Deltaproteobacteria bacterium]|nr:deoxynucleoside kinase [Deltaproteobacteria bacterium]
MSLAGAVLEVVADPAIARHQIPNRLTDVERRLMEFFSKNQKLITCVGNIGTGKSSLIKFLAYHTSMNALFELPEKGFEDHLLSNDALYPLLATAKTSAKRTLIRYYGAINDFIECQKTEQPESAAWLNTKRHLEKAALDIQHAYLDLRKMQLQAIPCLQGSTCVDGYPLADRFAFCEALHRDMDVSYLTKEALDIVDQRLQQEFQSLRQTDLLILLKAPPEYLLDNIRERNRGDEGASKNDLSEGLVRLVTSLHRRYEVFVDTLRKTNWYLGPVLTIDVSQIDFVSNVRHLIAVFEGVEKLLVANHGTAQ